MFGGPLPNPFDPNDPTLQAAQQGVSNFQNDPTAPGGPNEGNYGQDYSNDTYGDGVGDSGQFTAPDLPKTPLASSPEWLAYLNSQGLDEAQFRANIDRQRAAIQAEITRQTQQLGPTYDAQRRGIAGNEEVRGMARSGEFLRKLAESRAQQGQAAANIQASGAQQIGGLEASLANKLSDLQSTRADRELTLRTQGYS